MAVAGPECSASGAGAPVPSKTILVFPVVWPANWFVAQNDIKHWNRSSRPTHNLILKVKAMPRIEIGSSDGDPILYSLKRGSRMLFIFSARGNRASHPPHNQGIGFDSGIRPLLAP